MMWYDLSLEESLEARVLRREHAICGAITILGAVAAFSAPTLFLLWLWR